MLTRTTKFFASGETFSGTLRSTFEMRRYVAVALISYAGEEDVGVTTYLLIQKYLRKEGCQQ